MTYATIIWKILTPLEHHVTMTQELTHDSLEYCSKLAHTGGGRGAELFVNIAIWADKT